MSIHEPLTAEMLPPGYTLRPLTFDDADAWLDLEAASLVEIGGQLNMTPDEIRATWQKTGFHLDLDTRGVFAADGQLVAWAEVFDARALPVRARLTCFVRPEHRGRGIGTALLRWQESNAPRFLAKLPEDARFTFMGYGLRDVQTDHLAMLQAHGYEYVRSAYHMQMSLDGEIAPPVWPEDIELVTMAEHPVLRDFAYGHQESFRDHRGVVDEPLENVIRRWEEFNASVPSLDPALWWLVRQRGEIAAVLMALPDSEDDPDMAWVEIVGTLPAFRRQGLAEALLRHAFREFQRRGIPRVGLGVDASSLTGATRLYERIGMHAYRIWDVYEKIVRDGIEYSRQGEAG